MHTRATCVYHTTNLFIQYEMSFKVVSEVRVNNSVACIYLDKKRSHQPHRCSMHKIKTIQILNMCWYLGTISYHYHYSKLRGPATNSYGFTWFLLFYTCFSLIFVSDVFMVLKHHHLQLQTLTSRLSLASLT